MAFSRRTAPGVKIGPFSISNLRVENWASPICDTAVVATEVRRDVAVDELIVRPRKEYGSLECGGRAKRRHRFGFLTRSGKVKAAVVASLCHRTPKGLGFLA